MKVHLVSLQMEKRRRRRRSSKYFTDFVYGQLQNEIKRGSWRMVATNADKLWNELQHQNDKDDNATSILRGAGLGMRQSLMKHIEQGERKTVDSTITTTNSFSGLMLKE